MDYNEVAENLTTRGDFIWKNGIQDSEVIWIPNNKGKWEICWVPDEDKRNLIETKYNKKRPGNSINLVAGCDPYDHDTTTDGRRSNAACHVYHKFTMDENAPCEQFVCEYIFRPPKAEIFYEDMIKQCVFYGCQILIENNKIGIIKYFERRGYYEYLMDRPESTHTDFSKKQQTKGIPGTGVAVINAQAEAVATYIYDHVGLKPDTGEIGKCYFNRLLDDWSRFDINNRTKFDATISSSLALLASQKFVRIREESPKFVKFVKTYSNRGKLSKKIR